MRRLFYASGEIVFIALLFVSALAQSASPTPPPPSNSRKISIPPEKSQPIHIPRFDKPPVIDGKLDDEIWTHAAVLKDFTQINPGDNVAPSRQVVMMIGYDSK